MPIRITGMNSGLDTESIITELMKAQQTKVDNVKKQQTKLQWKQDAWKALNTKVHTFFSSTLNNMRFSTDYSKKTTDVSNSSVAKVVTGDRAMNAVHKLVVGEAAASGYLTGGQLEGNYNKNSKLTELGITVGSSISVTADGKTTDITVTADMTINGLVTNLQSAGVDANFDEKNSRFYISAKKSGKDGDFAITASNENGTDALNKLKILSYDETVISEYKKYAECGTDGAKKQAAIDAEVAQRLSYYLSQKENLTKSLEEQTSKVNSLKEGYEQQYGEPIGTVSSEKLAEDIDDAKQVLEELDKDDPDYEAKLKAAAEKLSELQMKKAHVDNYDKAEEEQQKIQASLDNANTYIASDGISASDKLKEETVNKINAKIAAAEKALQEVENGSTGNSAGRISGADGKITLNGVEYTSTSNVYEVNGLTITVTGSKGDETTLSTRQDTDGIYDMIKNFIKEYNALIKEMDGLYDAESIKGYEPLTDEDKEDMSDSEVEKWEQKIKDSILRRDSNLSTVASTLKNIMLAGAEVDGTKLYLSNFGIETLGYFKSADHEKNAYHIDGDKDDSSTGTNEDKLKAAIAADPDTVISFFSQLSQNLYSNLNSLTAGTDLRSFGSIYDDKKMQEDYNNYTTKVKDMEKKLKAMEDRYYNQFAAMETALARLQSNQSAVTSLLGG